MIMGSITFSRSRTWCVEITSVAFSSVYFSTAERNCALDGMSRPLVGSSMKRYLVLQARQKLMYVFLSCPADMVESFCSVSVSNSRITETNLSREKPGQKRPRLRAHPRALSFTGATSSGR